MFQEYQKYIENIRNSMIQNNIQLDVTELNTYSDVFYYALKLEQVIWFYQAMGIGGSGFYLKSPYILTECYKEKVRQIAYKDFIQFLEGYRDLYSRYKSKQGLESKPVNINEDVDLDEDIDLFEEDSVDVIEDIVREEFIPTIPEVEEIENEYSPQTFLNFIQSYSNPETDMLQLSQSEGDFVHGIYIDEWTKSNTEDYIEETLNEDSVEEIVHGIYIDEWERLEVIKEDSNNEIHGIYIDEWEKPAYKSEDIHGVYIDEWVAPVKEEKVEEPMFDEDIFEDPVVDFSEYEYEDSVFENNTEVVKNEVNIPNKNQTKTVSNGQKDISDSIQDVTNKLLTEGKRLFVKKVKKLQQ